MIKRRAGYTLPPISLGSFLLELLIVGICLVALGRTYWNFDPALRPNGSQWIFLLASGGYAREVLLQSGSIPLWNPFIGSGEPLLESLQSYILNPFMFLPVLAWGTIQGGKVAILIHALIMGMGGWTLGRVLRMNAPGRVLLGVILMGSGGYLAAVGEGHFQIGLSLTYVPLILAGLIGILYLPRRWPIGVFVVSFLFLILAGSFWHVLSTLITCTVIGLFGLIDWSPEKPFKITLNWTAFGRLFITVILLGLLSMIRVLPQVEVTRYIAHPQEELRDAYTPEQVAQVYFEATAGPAAQSYWLRYAYTFPGVFALIIGVVWLIVKPGVGKAKGEIILLVIPLALLIVFYSWWAMGNTPLFKWLYTNIAGLGHWRRMGRFAAAAVPLIAVLIVMMFDNVFARIQQVTREKIGLGIGVPLLKLRLPFPAMLSQLILPALVIVGAFSAFDVMNNWQRVTSVVRADPFDGRLAGVTASRLAFPTDFLNVETLDMPSTPEFFNTLTRMFTGNNELVYLGYPATIPAGSMIGNPARIAAGFNTGFLSSRKDAGYEPVPGTPELNGINAAWVHPKALPYSFMVTRQRIDYPEPLRAEHVTALEYVHSIDHITVNVPPRAEPQVVFAWETNYPGWTVKVNGEPARLESVFGRLGVVIPAGDSAVTVHFSFYPSYLNTGAALSGIGMVLFTVYILRLDGYLPKPKITLPARTVTPKSDAVETADTTPDAPNFFEVVIKKIISLLNTKV
jgi:hypothetical protein